MNLLKKRQYKQQKQNLLLKLNNGVNRSAVVAEETVTKAVEKVKDTYIPHKTKKIIIITGSIITLFFLSLYVPAILFPDKQVYYSLAYNKNAIYENSELYVSNPDDDFDNDGLTNLQEFNMKTNMFEKDSDNDGLSDGYEYYDISTDPLKKNNDILSITKAEDDKNDKTIKSPYEDEGVILWADSYVEKSKSVVIPDKNGYIIKNFKGWAQFPDSLDNYVYKYKDGKFSDLKYRETENAYYIDEDCEIVILKHEITYKYEISFVKFKGTINNGIIGNILNFILPSSGKTYLKCNKLPDFEENTENTTTLIRTSDYESTDVNRISKNTNQLSDITKVWNSVFNKSCVYVSFFNEKKGECVGIIYGYTSDGDLLVADPETREYAGTITIEYNGRKIVNKGSTQKELFFDFEGLGFSSKKGDRINFFGKQSDSNTFDYFS